MADGLARVLSKPGFDAENFVNKLSQQGEDDLQDMRKKVQTLAEDTAIALKKNVYKNYSQFIETAKEISILEGEMYQLSHMLTDQKSIMASMLEMSLTGEKVEGPEEPETPEEEDTQKNLAFLLEKVEGCSSVTEVPGRQLVHDGDLVELDPESFTQVNKVHIFLLNDSLMIATWLPYRRGPVKYRFQRLYELDSLAVVNARDAGPCKNAFKILMFPDTRMFQAENPKAKRQWLDILEETKKKKAALESQRKEAAQERMNTRMSTRISSNSFDANNPFAEEVEEEPEEEESLRSTSMLFDMDFLHEEWIQELPEDLDVCIAQRDFEGAVDLVEKVNEYLLSCPKSATVKEYKGRIEHRVKQLTEVLIHELQVSPERSLRGGPRAARRAVAQLIRLGKSAQACRLFLENRSAITKYNIMQLKIEGATSLYVKRLCEVFFGDLMDTGKEFIKAFPQHFGCYSAFVLWAKKELQTFVDTFSKQVFVSKATMSTVSECVAEARQGCNRLSEIGLELTFVLDGSLVPEIQKVLKDGGDHQMEAVKHRASEDLWRPINFQNTESVERFEEEMMDLGIVDIHDFTYDDCFTVLTANTIHFTKSFLPYCEDILRLHCQELHIIITSVIVNIIKAQLQHAETSCQSAEFKNEQGFILQNATFLMEKLIPLVHERYNKKTGLTLKTTDFHSLMRKIKATCKKSLGEIV